MGERSPTQKTLEADSWIFDSQTKESSSVRGLSVRYWVPFDVRKAYLDLLQFPTQSQWGPALKNT